MEEKSSDFIQLLPTWKRAEEKIANIFLSDDFFLALEAWVDSIISYLFINFNLKTVNWIVNSDC